MRLDALSRSLNDLFGEFIQRLMVDRRQNGRCHSDDDNEDPPLASGKMTVASGEPLDYQSKYTIRKKKRMIR